MKTVVVIRNGTAGWSANRSAGPFVRKSVFSSAFAGRILEALPSRTSAEIGAIDLEIKA
jgi:hypothetical protein